MIPKEKIIKRLESQIALCKEIESDWITITVGSGKRILELLNDQEEKKRRKLQYIADLQLSNAPNEFHNENQRMYEKGVYDGLQMAFEILAEEIEPNQ